MPIGGRNPAPSGKGWPGTPATMTGASSGGSVSSGVPAGGGVGCGCDTRPATRRRWQPITADARDATALALGPAVMPVAELPAPGAGEVYVLERLVIENLVGATSIVVMVGDLSTASVVDYAPAAGIPLLVAADAQPIVVPPGQAVLIAWAGPSAGDAPRCRARLQIRVEAA